ncbi:MAG: zinc-binding dehydrogenase [Armatimonadota bacterium]
MKAARLLAKGDIKVMECDKPEPGEGEALIAVKAVAICPSDVRIYREGESGGVAPEGPLTLGHEFAGVVDECPGADPAFAPGTRVAVEPSWYCGECDLCLSDHQNICRNLVFPSFPPNDGALADYICCPTSALAELPEGTTWTEGALLEPLGVAIHAVRLAELQPTHRIGILGAGVIGLSILQVARACGVGHAIVAEPNAKRRPMAKKLGAARVARSAERLLELIEDPAEQPDVVLEASGDPAAFEESCELAKPGGAVIVVGIPSPDEVTFASQIPRRKELTITFSRRSRDTLRTCASMLARKDVDLSSYPVQTFSLDEAPEAIETAAKPPDDVLRAVVLME